MMGHEGASSDVGNVSQSASGSGKRAGEKVHGRHLFVNTNEAQCEGFPENLAGQTCNRMESRGH